MRFVRTQFNLAPKRGWTQVHVAQTMNLQSAGKRAGLILGQNIGFQCKKGSKVRTWYFPLDPLRTCPKDMIFLFLFFFSPFSDPLSFFLSSFYIPQLFCLSHHPRVDLAFNVLFSLSPRLLLNLPFLAGKLFVHCSGITSTLMRPEGQLGDI